MKQIIDQNIESEYLQTSSEFSSYNKQNYKNLGGKCIKNIIKSLQANYRNKLKEEGIEIIPIEDLISLLPTKTGFECQICFEDKQNKNDKIVKCIVCREKTHQKCYGSDLIGKKEIKDWVCQRCRELIKCQKDYDINKCVFCPKITGLTKKIDTNLWAHITCVNLIPDIFFLTESRENVDLTNLKAFRKSICNICGKRLGYICDKGRCKYQMHITCGISAGSIFNWGLMQKLQGKKKINNEFVEIYCPKHTLEFLQERSDKLSYLNYQTTHEESNNHEEKYIGKKIKIDIPLDEILSNEDNENGRLVSSFNLIIDKILNFIDEDRERIKNKQISLFSQESADKFHRLIRNFISTYKSFNPDVYLLYDKLKDTNYFNN